MIRANALHHRAVVDLDAAEKLGEIEEIVLDAEAGRLAGFVVGSGRGFGGSSKRQIVTAEAVHAIGDDAVTIHSAEAGSLAAADLADLPRVSRITGMKLITQDGTVLGTVDDVLIDEASRQIVAYAFDRIGATAGGLGDLLNLNRQRHLAYLQTGSGLRVGEALIVVPPDSVVGEEPNADGIVVDERTASDPLTLSDRDDRYVSSPELQSRAVAEPAGPDEVTRVLDWDFEPSSPRATSASPANREYRR